MNYIFNEYTLDMLITIAIITLATLPFWLHLKAKQPKKDQVQAQFVVVTTGCLLTLMTLFYFSSFVYIMLLISGWLYKHL